MATASETISAAPRAYFGFDGQFINGTWRPGRRGAILKDTDPYTGKTLAEIQMADQSDLDEAYQSAAKAQPAWAALLPAERAAVMYRFAAIMDARRGEIIDWLIQEAGSTLVKAGFETQFVHGLTLEVASFPNRVQGRILPINEPGKESRVYRRPIGVVGVISPWNFPLILSHRSIAPAIVLGNTVVVKPAPDTPVTGGLLIAKIFEEAGLPPGVLNVVVGDVKDIGDAFTLHPIPGLISFTGSTKVGRHIAELAATGPRLKRVALELGGNSPLVVLDDADVDRAVNAAVMGRFFHQGQICMSTNRIIVDAHVYDDFVDGFTAHVKTLKYGDPSNPETAVGPIINASQLAGIVERIKGATAEGARAVLSGDPQGQVVPPHIFADVKNSMRIAQSEIFGPVAPIIKVQGEAEALQVANDTEYGLSSAVFSKDEDRALRFALRIEAGMSHINDSTVDDSPTGPFGGEKNSGIGRFGGDWSINEFTTEHWVTIQHTPRGYPF